LFYGSENVMQVFDGTSLKDIVICKPVYAWQCRLVSNVVWQIEEGKEPNWFHRKMQELCFGFKWERLK
jgi:hypothetical protein